MMLLDWMHQKIKRGGIVPFKDLSIGSCYTCISTHNEKKHAKYQTKITSNWRIQRGNQEETFSESPIIFDGFLSIGFLGSEKMISEPVTPTFANVADGQFAVTGNGLRFINEELEKFLENEANEENMESSGRNSQASVISLANMLIEGDGFQEQAEPEQMTVCPLQDYLFGSAIELPCSGEDEKKKMSLRELFQRSEQSERSPEDGHIGENVDKKEHNKFSLLSLNKLLKKIQTPNTIMVGAGEVASTRKKNKFHKVLKMLRRKVHPERSSGTNSIGRGELNGKIYQVTNPSDKIERHELNSPLSEKYPKSKLLTESREQWIKTDTDYFVLEL